MRIDNMIVLFHLLPFLDRSNNKPQESASVLPKKGFCEVLVFSSERLKAEVR